MVKRLAAFTHQQRRELIDPTTKRKFKEREDERLNDVAAAAARAIRGLIAPAAVEVSSSEGDNDA